MSDSGGTFADLMRGSMKLDYSGVVRAEVSSVWVGEKLDGERILTLKSRGSSGVYICSAVREKSRIRVIGLGGKKSGWGCRGRAISNEGTGDDDCSASGDEEKFRPPSAPFTLGIFPLWGSRLKVRGSSLSYAHPNCHHAANKCVVTLITAL